MLARFAVIALSLGSAVAHATDYAVESTQREVNDERRVLVEQAQRRLRAELRRRGVTVLERGPGTSRNVIVLTPRLEVVPGGLSLKLVGVRGDDRSLVGTVTTRARGSNRAAVLDALVSRACDEAIQL